MVLFVYDSLTSCSAWVCAVSTRRGSSRGGRGRWGWYSGVAVCKGSVFDHAYTS